MSSPKEVAMTLCKAGMVEFDVDKLKQVVDESYIQHNPLVPAGAEFFFQGLPILKEMGMKITIHRAIAEKDMVALHMTYENAAAFGLGDKPLVTFDVFRIKDGKAVEHWDCLMPQDPPVGPSGHTMVDGATEITDLDKTEVNKKLVEEFCTKFLIADGKDGNEVFGGEQMNEVKNYISEDKYIQHNTMVADGLGGLQEGLKKMAEAGIKATHSQLHIIIAEGNFVFVMREGTFNDKACAYQDLFRVEDGKIVEHWECIAVIPDEPKNDNGVF